MLHQIFSSFYKKHQSWAPFFLRLAIGSGFMVHGWAKINRGTAGFEKMLNTIHVSMAHLAANTVPYIELLGGLAIFIGLFVGLVSILLIGTMLVAMFSIQLKFGFSSVKTIGLTPEGPLFGPPGYEINLLYITGLMALIILGAGKLSVDAILSKER